VWQTLAIVGLIFTTTFIHELGHAVVCDYYGADVRSLGIMVFYLQPAAYADVTDSWQLRNRWHRVAISAAGIYVQALISSFSMILWTIWRLTGHRGGGTLVMFMALNTVVLIFNVLPFAKLDGYWMLSNSLGIANLRERSLEWLRVSARAALTRRPVDAARMRFNAVLSMPALDRSLLGFYGMTCVLFGMSMWTGGLAFLFRVTRWAGMRSSTSVVAVGVSIAGMAVAFGVSRVFAARRNRATQPAAARPGETPVSAAVTHHIDPTRPIRLNAHVSALDNGDGAVTFGWSTPDAITVRVPPGFFEALPMLRAGSTTLQQLKQSDLWSPAVEQAIQRLWHDRHLRYTSEWELAEENVRYSRQLGWLSMNTKVRGKEAEVLARLRQSSVTVLGVGGLGTHVAWNLAACGVGELNLVDGDTIELSNLNRQLFYTPADIGLRKVDVAAERLLQFNPQMRIRKTHMFLESLEDIAGIIEGSDFVIRAIDSPQESMAWVNEACINAGIPYSGAGFFPQGTIVGPTVIPGETACLACNAPATTPRFDRGTGGTLAPLVFTTAGILASETINFLGKLGSVQTAGRMLTINAPALNFTFSDVRRNEQCPLCGREERMSA
jgi:molybdopterin/thiamine biosynthesis adenylyltransferase